MRLLFPKQSIAKLIFNLITTAHVVNPNLSQSSPKGRLLVIFQETSLSKQLYKLVNNFLAKYDERSLWTRTNLLLVKNTGLGTAELPLSSKVK